MKTQLIIVGVMIGAMLLAACAGTAGLSGKAASLLTPANAYRGEAGLKVIAAAGQAAAQDGRLTAANAHVARIALVEVQAGLPAFRHAFDTKDYIGATLQLAALAIPAAQAQAAASGSTAPPSIAGDVAAAVGLLTSASATYAEAQAVLAGDPAALPAALVIMRGEVDAQLTASIAALAAIGG